MPLDNYYIYCVIEGGEGLRFGPIGIDGDTEPVFTITLGGMSAVLSKTSKSDYSCERKHLLGHEKVIEAVMKDFVVLPVRFGTIATSLEDIRTVLRKRGSEFRGLVADMRDKVELGLKVFYVDEKVAFKEVAEENTDIRKLRERIEKSSPEGAYYDRIRLGEMVGERFSGKKEKEKNRLLEPLKKIAYDSRENRLMSDRMLINAAFLVNLSSEKKFDDRVNLLESENQERLKFKYVGPVPPFNFVNIVVEWKKL